MKMHLNGALSLVPLLAALCKGAIMVNLTDEVKNYVQEVNKTRNIIDWGLSYAYVIGIRDWQGDLGFPISTRVDKLECVPEDANRDGVQKMRRTSSCTEEFTLDIDRGMYIPFTLSTVVRFPLMGQRRIGEKYPVDVALNNREIFHKTIGASSPGEPILKSCKFEVKATIYGTFAYHLKGKLIEDGKYVSVPVGRLANSSKKLIASGDNLEYNLTGYYTETVCH
uniref:DA-P36 family member n=1 Tax=Rhipicephalus appendiculatus TaxID=34631 RepID=A0A131YW49_RHIAP